MWDPWNGVDASRNALGAFTDEPEDLDGRRLLGGFESCRRAAAARAVCEPASECAHCTTVGSLVAVQVCFSPGPLAELGLAPVPAQPARAKYPCGSSH